MGAKAGSKRSRSASKGPPAKKAKTPAKKQATKAVAKKQKATKKGKAKPASKAKAAKVSKAKPTPKAAPKAKAAASTKKPAPAKKAPAGPAVPVPSGKLSDDDKVKHWRALKAAASIGTVITAIDLDPFTAKDLKQALKHNDRSTTGNRGDLTKAIIDNMMKGCPPRCPKCGGGRLRYGKKDGVEQYFCPGYMEDDDFVNCSFRGDDSSVTRVPWKSL